MDKFLTIEPDRANAFIRVTGAGLWSPEGMTAHFLALGRALEEARGQFGHARVLVDLRKAVVQTAEAAEAMDDGTARIYKKGDSVAVICSPSLAMQIKLQDRVFNLATFRELDPGLDWLLSCPGGEALATDRIAGKNA